MSTTLDLPAPNAPSGYLLPDLVDLVEEFGASYPLLGYLVADDAAAPEVVARLNELFEALVPVIARHGGHVD